EVANVDLFGCDDQPPVADLGRYIHETKADHRTARRNQGGVDVTMQIPHQQLGIEVFIADPTDPAHSPGTEIFHDCPELLARGSQPVLDFMSIMAALDDAGTSKVMQPLGEQARRHLRYAAAEVVEVPAAQQQLADDEHRPSLVQQLHGFRNGTELVIRGAHEGTVSLD